jgi:hypothetical protein
MNTAMNYNTDDNRIHYKRIYGFDDTKSQVDIDLSKTYGLACYIHEWMYWTGSFTYVYGVHDGFASMLLMLHTGQMGDYDPQPVTVFYELDSDNNPITIIPHAIVTPNIRKELDSSQYKYYPSRNVVKRDLTTQHVLTANIAPVDWDEFA